MNCFEEFSIKLKELATYLSDICESVMDSLSEISDAIYEALNTFVNSNNKRFLKGSKKVKSKFLIFKGGQIIYGVYSKRSIFS